MAFPARIALALVLFAAPVGAQVVASQDVLPDKPAPRGNFLTRPFYDKRVAIFAEVDAGATAWDDIASRKVIGRGGYERNPFMRPFVHNSGTLAAESVAEVWLAAFVAERMKRSQHTVLRKTWWLPEVLHTAARLYGGISNTVLLSR